MRTPFTRSPLFRSLAIATIAATALTTTGCARNKTKGDTPYVARDVGTLYTAARKQLNQKNYKIAAALFDEVERQHPYSVWARRAQLMSAYSYYLARDYTASIQSAQRFLTVHPGNRDAAYAYYLVSLGYYEQINDVTRDQKITQQALDSLGELERRYPNTRYAEDARLKVDLVRDHLAGKEMEIGRFYEVRGQWLAANGRFRKVVEDYQTTTHVPEALMRLTETYLALGVPDEARKSAAVLGFNYPGTIWYARAFKLTNEHPPIAIAAIAPGQQIVPDNIRTTQSLPGQNDAHESKPSAKPVEGTDSSPTPASAPATGGSSTTPGNPAPGN